MTMLSAVGLEDVSNCVSLLTGALAKDSGGAQAPAGQPRKPVADLLFILSADMVSPLMPV